MEGRLISREDEDLLMERLVQVENALFCLKVRSSCVDSEEVGCEVERLERIRRELHQCYAQIYRRPHEPIPNQDIA